MDLRKQLSDLQITDISTITYDWFDYNLIMNAIIDELHKRICSSETKLHTNSPIINQLNSITHDNLSRNEIKNLIRDKQFSQDLHDNSADTLFQQSRRNVFTSKQFSTIEQQFDKLHLSSDASIEPITIDNVKLSNIFAYADPSNHSLTNLQTLSPVCSSQNRMKMYAYELAAVFENTFDQLSIIYHSLSTNSLHKNHNQHKLKHNDLNNIYRDPLVSDDSHCILFSMNLVEVFMYHIMNEYDKFRYETKYLFHILLLLFRAILLESQTDFVTRITNMNNKLPSIHLFELNNRLKESQNRIQKLSYTKKKFQTKKSQTTNTLLSIKAELNDQLMEDKYHSTISLRYCNNWKKNHILQWIEMLLETEKNYTKTIRDYENMAKQVEVSHNETIKILSKQNHEMKANVDKWFKYYINEINRFEKELTNFRQEFFQVRKRRQDLCEEYQRMKIIVDEYNQVKIAEKLFFEKQKQQESAIKHIQTWWRGARTRRKKQQRRRKKKKTNLALVKLSL